MSSDYNATIRDVDSAMDMLESYAREANDVRAHVLFDLSSLFAAVDQRLNECERRIDIETRNCYEQQDDRDCSMARLNLLLAQAAQLKDVKRCCSVHGLELYDKIKQLFLCAETLTDEGLQEMGRYISKLNLIAGRPENCENMFRPANGAVFVCVIDSARYPQTAEHIRTAQSMGFPSLLTVDKDHAAERRKASLKNVAANRAYDRDEYPCAIFSEGGRGADVVYVQGRDNRGAGSHMRWQLQGIPDGAQIRIRVI